MKHKFIIILLFIMTSCEFIDIDHFQIEPELKEIVDKFYNEAYKRKIILKRNLIVEFSDLSDQKLSGLAYPNEIIPRVLIDIKTYQDYKIRSVNYGIEYVVFHELGHALLKRAHDDNRYTIMTSNSKFMGYYRMEQSKRELLIDELFTKSN